ncbi:MAG TPA: sugar transferase [Thermoleophilaceae bacterium]|jgi:exopolysaccharide biosynthesis polyprenyl glycosylphosphotransferase
MSEGQLADAPAIDVTEPTAPPLTGKRRFVHDARTRAGGGMTSPLRIPAVRRATTDVRALEAEARSTSTPIREGDRAAETLDRDALHRRALAVADMFSAAAVLLGAVLIGGGTPRFGLVAILPVVVLISKVVGLYDRDEHVLHKTTLDETPKLFHVALTFAFLAFLADDLLATHGFDKPEILFTLGALVILLGANRSLARRLALRAATAERILVLGSAVECRRIEEKLDTVSPVKAEIVGRVPVSHEPRSERGDEVLGMLPELDFVLRRERIDRVVICPHGDSSTDMLDTIRTVKGLGVKVSVMPRLFEVVGSSVEFDELGGMTLLGIRRYELTKSSAFLKRALDVAGASVGLVLLAPFFITMAIAIKVGSPGHVFFRQRRVGRGGTAFDMFKFRTMYAGADRAKADLLDLNEADGFFKIADDPRVTGIGRILRRSSLDELPQLINVLRGEMSLVGPRPLVYEEDARIEGFSRRRLDVTPGMTGAWQVLGSSRVPMRDMITIDYLYRANWSLWLDLKILLRTVPHVVRRRGM